MDVIVRCTLRDRRKSRGYSLRDLASKTGVNRGSISKYENDVEVMNVVTAAKFAILLDCKIDDLYEYRQVAGEV